MAAGLSQARLAALIEYDVRQIKRWEAGQYQAPAGVIEILRGLVASSPRPQGPGEFTFIDLFAGIGGLRLGFESAGGRCVFTSEWDPYCQKTYKANFGNEDIKGDITELQCDDIPDHDVLLAGFPCQPFSIAGVSKKKALGRPHGFDCETQGTLFFDVERILAGKRPKAFLLENVKHLLNHDGGRTYQVIRTVLEHKLNYKVFPKVLDARPFVPQHRERIYLVGFSSEVPFRWSEVAGPEENDWPRLRSVLHGGLGVEEPEDPYTDARGRADPKYTLSDHLWRYLQAYAAKHREAGNGFGFGLVGPRDVARTLSARYYKDGSEILVKQPGKNPRRLTPRECARLMGFDSNERKFKIPVSDTRAYKQFGNSVVVPVIRKIAEAMRPHILTLKRPTQQLELALAMTA